MAHVLLVDDHRPILIALTRLLENRMHVVSGVQDAASALDAIGPHIDVVVTDLTMPGMDGVDLVKALRDRGSDVPIIVMTGKLPDDDEVEGAVEVLLKPFSPDLLAAAVERAVATRRGRKDAGPG